MKEGDIVGILENLEPFYHPTITEALEKGKCFDYTKGPVSPRVKRFMNDLYIFFPFLFENVSPECLTYHDRYTMIEPELTMITGAVELDIPQTHQLTITHDHIDIHISTISVKERGQGSLLMEALLLFCEIFKKKYGYCPTIRCECLGTLGDHYSPEEPTIEKQLRFFQKHGFKIDKISKMLGLDDIYYLSYNP
jgi:hypothetical protein